MSSPPSDTPGRERGPDEVFCRNCGAVIDSEAEICPSCGVRQRPPPKSSVDSAVEDVLQGGNPFVAALLSALFPGLGQIYNRELERGLAFVVGAIVAAFSTLIFVGFILYPAVWLFSIYDAYTRAERRAQELRAEAHANELPVSEPAEVDVGTEGDEVEDESEPAAETAETVESEETAKTAETVESEETAETAETAEGEESEEETG